MPSSAFVFRIEGIFVDSQRTAHDWGGDDDILTIFVRVDDNPTYSFSMPVGGGGQLISSTSVGLGFLGQTDPINIGPDALVTTLYVITNYSGYTLPNQFSEFQQIIDSVMPFVDAVGNLFDINIAQYQKYLDDALVALGFIYGGGEPDCHGPVFAGGFQYVGSELANFTDGYVIHRPPTVVQGPITGGPLTSQGGCGTPEYRINIAVERVPPTLDFISTAEGGMVFLTTPFQAPQSIGFDLALPPGFGTWSSLGGAATGEPAYVTPNTAVPWQQIPFSLHCFALGADTHSIFHKWKDSTGWHPGPESWEQLPGKAIGGIRAVATATQIDLFVTGQDNKFYHATMTGEQYQVFSGWTVGAPWVNGGDVIGPPFVVQTRADGFDVFGVRVPNNDVYIFDYLDTYVEPGGWISWQTWGPTIGASFSIVTGWLDRSGGDTPAYDLGLDGPSPGFRALSGASLACTSSDNGGPNLIAVGRDGAVYATMTQAQPSGPTGRTGYSATAPALLGGQGVTMNPAAAVNYTNDGTQTWVAFVDGNHRMKASQYWGPPYYTWYPTNDTGPGYAPFIPEQYDLGGSCTGRPVIVPFGNRIYFFVIGTDDQVYWKFSEPANTPGNNATVSLNQWEYPIWSPSQDGWYGPIKNGSFPVL